MNRTDINSNIDEFFSKTKELLSHDYEMLFDGQGSLNSKIRPSCLPLSELIQVLNKLNVTLDSVIENRIDYSVLTSQYASHDMMPSKYMDKAALSSRFTGMYMINYVSNIQGEKAARILMQNFQLKETQFKDTNLKNNIMLATDLCEYIYKYYGSEEVFQMGQHITSILKNTVHGQALAKSRNVLSMFELFFEEIAPKHIEKNFKWEIEDYGTDFITVSGCLNEQLKDSFQLELKESFSLPSLYAGITKALPDLLGNYHTDVKILKSIQNGDDCNMFKLAYAPVNNLFH
jgi:hypothetical protein